MNPFLHWGILKTFCKKSSKRQRQFEFLCWFIPPVSLSLLEELLAAPALLASLLSTVVSIVGVVVTTMINWRRGRREKEAFSFDQERKSLELEMLRLEIARKRREDS